jgi:hypothetical protein
MLSLPGRVSRRKWSNPSRTWSASVYFSLLPSISVCFSQFQSILVCFSPFQSDSVMFGLPGQRAGQVQSLVVVKSESYPVCFSQFQSISVSFSLFQSISVSFSPFQSDSFMLSLPGQAGPAARTRRAQKNCQINLSKILPLIPRSLDVFLLLSRCPLQEIVAPFLGIIC